MKSGGDDDTGRGESTGRDEADKIGLLPCIATMGCAFAAFGLVRSSMFPWPAHRATAAVAIWLYLPLLSQRFDGVELDFATGSAAFRRALPVLLRCVVLTLLPFAVAYAALFEGMSSAIPPIRHAPTATGLLELLLFHALFVALPEEFFFRAYLQQRLDRSWGTRWTLLGTRLGPGWLVANLSFTLCHLVPASPPARILVFFPGLLFGWFLARTRSIWATALLHLLANGILVLVPALLSRG